MALSRGRKEELKDLDYVLLCLINMHEDASGYQLKSFMEKSTGYLYRAHLSQIYPALKRLHESGMVTMREVAREGKPDLKLYRITEAGQQASFDWLNQPYEFRNTRENGDKLFMRLVFMGHLEPEKTLQYIDMGIRELQRQRDEHADNNLKRELEYLTVTDPEIRNRYAIIWDQELSFVLAEYDLRIEWLHKIRNLLVQA
jgi:DNA-binding PadR family transcriptional regulator